MACAISVKTEVKKGQPQSVVNFELNFSVHIAELTRKAPNGSQIVISPELCTVHNNLGHRWRIALVPTGDQVYSFTRCPNNVGVYLLSTNPDCLKAPSPLSGKCFPAKVASFPVERQPFYVSYSEAWNLVSLQYLTKAEWNGRSVGRVLSPETPKAMVDGELVHVCIPIRLGAKYFEWKLHFDALIPHAMGQGISRAEDYLEKLRVTYDCNIRPSDDEQKLLDFRIVTKDNKCIWCHKLFLGLKSDFVGRSNATQMKEGLHQQMELQYDTEVAMELVPYIYVGRISDKFRDLELNNLLDGATFLGLPGLRLNCEEQYIWSLDLDNFVEFLIIADRYDLCLLKEICLVLASENPVIIWKSGMVGPNIRNSLWVQVLEVSEARIKVSKVLPAHR